MAKRIVVVGGSAAGMSAAARLRRLDERAHITVFEQGPYVSYANCSFPYVIGKKIKDRNHMFLQTPLSLKKRFNIDVFVFHTVVSIDRGRKEVTMINTADDTRSSHAYDFLILCPGAKPVVPPLPGVDHPAVFALWNVPDTDKIMFFLETKRPSNACIVGGGFIGLEMAENLGELGLHVTIVEMFDQVMPALDYEMAAIIQNELVQKGVTLHLGSGVERFTDASGKVAVTLKNGKSLIVDMLLLSIGVRPRTELAAGAGLDIGPKGGILVNEHLQTSDPSIYAGGDAIECLNPLTGKQAYIPLAGPANRQGRMIADNIITGNTRMYPGNIGTSVLKVFDLTVASTGLSEKACIAENIACKSALIHGTSHAGYYPGAKMLSLKLVFHSTDHKILGAQAIGMKGADKRIDVIATAIRAGMTVSDLTQLELAYAPPYSSAKDPVVMIGYVAENFANGLVDLISWKDLASFKSDETFLLDVRTATEFKQGTLPDAVNIPIDTLRKHLDEIPENKSIILFCRVGFRGYVAARILLQNGFTNVYNLSGGYETYSMVMKYRTP